MNTYDLRQRVAIITGGAQGIGFAIAERMLESGASVAIWDRNPEVLDKAVADLALPQRVAGVEADIGDLASVQSAFAGTLEKFGKVDILINNAALVGPNMPTWEYPPEEFERVVHVGLIGTFNCCRTVVPHMRERSYGRIVNLSSIAGKEGNPNAVAYSSMKAAVIALTKSLGKELAGQNIAVNCVTPAVAKTPGAMEQSPEHIAYMLARIPRGRMLELGEAASMICWLASEENSFTTAAVFDLSGGRATY